ncbi:hypothetical protein Q8F55_007596 [Vanrija albida]|uniref:Copper transporter n=1 Tax=Vanrija albida TaxID=181172 RepID=A0ABR3PU98_9TREE
MAAAWEGRRVIYARGLRPGGTRYVMAKFVLGSLLAWPSPPPTPPPPPPPTDQLSNQPTLVMPAVSTTSPLLHGIRDLLVGMVAYAVMLVLLTLLVMAADHVRFKWYQLDRDTRHHHSHHQHQRLRKEFASPSSTPSSPPAELGPKPGVHFDTSVFAAAPVTTSH